MKGRDKIIKIIKRNMKIIKRGIEFKAERVHLAYGDSVDEFVLRRITCVGIDLCSLCNMKYAGNRLEFACRASCIIEGTGKDFDEGRSIPDRESSSGYMHEEYDESDYSRRHFFEAKVMAFVKGRRKYIPIFDNIIINDGKWLTLPKYTSGDYYNS